MGDAEQSCILARKTLGDFPCIEFGTCRESGEEACQWYVICPEATIYRDYLALRAVVVALLSYEDGICISGDLASQLEAMRSYPEPYWGRIVEALKGIACQE